MCIIMCVYVCACVCVCVCVCACVCDCVLAVVTNQFPISLEFVHTLESLSQHLLIDSTQWGHVLLTSDVAAHSTHYTCAAMECLLCVCVCVCVCVRERERERERERLLTCVLIITRHGRAMMDTDQMLSEELHA